MGRLLMGHRVKMRGALTCCVAGALLIVMSAGSASASDDADAGNSARKSFDQGKAAAEVGRFSEAAEHFRHSLELAPKASAAFNLAVALRGMGHPKEARDVLDQLLADKYGAPPDAMLPEAKRLRAEVAASVSRLVVILSGSPNVPLRADLRVDGVRYEYREALRIEVNPGAHVVSATAKSYLPTEHKLVVAAGGSQRVRLKLELSPEARMATLEVVAKERDARVGIVGVAWGEGRVRRRVEPGSYQLQLRSDAGDRDSSVTVRSGTSYRVELTPDQSSFLSTPWPWIVAGVVVTGAVVGGYFLLRDPNKEPVSDPEYRTVETLVRF
ncbi:MAG: tetratricopeptide repeat protein [Polyangiaceae bacterium]|nr:tetratricopeptide repeat protein [Polyangiaceae bacterium]MCB9609505.1 tetratricopeptide repeat protein [Polyangiaceae bacterium]